MSAGVAGLSCHTMPEAVHMMYIACHCLYVLTSGFRAFGGSSGIVLRCCLSICACRWFERLEAIVASRVMRPHFAADYFAVLYDCPESEKACVDCYRATWLKLC
jgi:hypothetical protein